MQKEYEQNEKKQEKGFKKFKKALLNIGIFAAALGLFATFSFPIGTVFGALSGIIGEEVARSIAFLTQIGCIGGSLGGIIINGIKAKKAKNEIDSLKEKNNDIVNKISNQNEEMKEKINELEKGNTIENSMKENNNIKEVIDYKELTTLYEKQVLEYLRELSTDSIEDDKEDINGYKSILNEISSVKNNNDLSDKEKFDRIQELYKKTLNLIKKSDNVVKNK